MRSKRSTARVRIFFLALISFFWLVLIGYRLVDLQVIRHAELARQVERQQQRTLEITPKRGAILDRNRRELAVSIGVDSVFAVPSEIENIDGTARALSRALKLDRTEIGNALRSGRSFVWIKRKIDAATTERVRALELPGIYFEREHKRFYPKRELAAHVLGFVGLDEDGLGGLEYVFNAQLRGAAESVVVTADGRRRTFRRSGEENPEGSSLVLTLDENLQYVAERELAAAVKGAGAASGSIIIEDPHTGEILAMANYPTFNPNNPTAVPTFYHVNRSVSLPYEPGSTFKVVTVAAALEEGLARPHEIIDCQMGGIVLAGHLIRDWKPFSLLSVREIIQHSSDVGTIKLALRLGERRLYEYIRRWGFGEKTGIELSAESRGIVRPPEDWSRISIGAVSMGQEIAVTPLQLAAAISAAANGGEWVQPHVVEAVERGQEPAKASLPARRRIIPEGVAEELRRMFAGVVTGGTGRWAQLRGYSSAGKTGTAQKIDETGTYSQTDYIASFVGFAPVMNPAITVVVTIDSPQGEENGGGDVAAPVFRKVAEQALSYLNVPPDLPNPSSPGGRGRDRQGTDGATGAGETSLRAVRADRSPQSLPGPSPREVLARRQAVQETELFGPRRGVRSIITRNEESVVLPDFAGLSLREVVVKCSALGLTPVLVGSGVVVSQSPEPAKRVPRGTRVRIELGPSLPKAPSRAM